MIRWRHRTDARCENRPSESSQLRLAAQVDSCRGAHGVELLRAQPAREPACVGISAIEAVILRGGLRRRRAALAIRNGLVVEISSHKVGNGHDKRTNLIEMTIVIVVLIVMSILIL